MTLPTVGDTVHYVSHGTPIQDDGTQVFESTCRAAIVTTDADVDRDDPDSLVLAGLCVLNPTGMFFQLASAQDEDGHAPGTWHWPEPEQEV